MYWPRGGDWYDGRVGIYERGITMLERAVRARWSSRIKASTLISIHRGLVAIVGRFVYVNISYIHLFSY